MMNKYKKHIDQFFREKLGNYRETPPPDVWDDLEQRLDGLATIPKPSAPGRWMWHVAIVSVILFMGASAVKKYYTGSNGTNKPIAANESTSSNTPANGSAATPAQTQNGANTAAATTASGSSSQTTDDNNNSNNNNGNNNNNLKNQSNNPATTPLLSNASKTNHSNPSGNKAGPGAAAATAHNRTSRKTNTGKNTYLQNTYSAPVAHNTYSNKLSNPSPEEEANETGANASPNTALSVVAKPEDSKNPAKQTVTENKKLQAKENFKKTRPSFARIEAGIKTGFEGGFISDAATKFVVSPYLQYNLSPKVAVMIQPAVKAASLRSHDLGTPTSYYSVNSETSQLVTDYSNPHTVGVGSTVDTAYWESKYTFSQSHDSIVKSNKTTARIAMQYELPILLKYNLTKKLAVYGGVNVVYSELVGITENTFTVKNIARSFDTTIITDNVPTPGGPTGLSMNYTGKPYSDYSGPMKPAQTGYQFNVGYMVGFSYTCHKKWLFDALVQQVPVKQDLKTGYNINTPLSTTYLRLSIGYKLSR